MRYLFPRVPLDLQSHPHEISEQELAEAGLSPYLKMHLTATGGRLQRFPAFMAEAVLLPSHQLQETNMAKKCPSVRSRKSESHSRRSTLQEIDFLSQNNGFFKSQHKL